MNLAGHISGITPGVLDVSIENFGALETGEITTSFASETALNLNEGEILFSLEGVNSINLVSGFTRAEAYVTDVLNIVEVSFRDEDTKF